VALCLLDNPWAWGIYWYPHTFYKYTVFLQVLCSVSVLLASPHSRGWIPNVPPCSQLAEDIGSTAEPDPSAQQAGRRLARSKGWQPNRLPSILPRLILWNRAEIPDTCSRKAKCMRTVRSQCVPVIEHLVKGRSQPWEHRWKQFTCATRRGGTSLHPP